MTPPPELVQINTPSGPLWRITYAGMTREHTQEWQAIWIYEQALLMYQSAVNPASNSIT
jgi:hypothetical protein